MNLYEENVVGNPWDVMPVKSRKHAKECIEIVLSNRKLTSLTNFDKFENLEALWLNNNNVLLLFVTIILCSSIELNT